MAIQFPANVAPGTTYTAGDYTWSWTGNRWAIAAVTSTVSVASNLSLVGTAILPTANVTFDIGTANLRWRDLYLAGNTIDLGGTAIKSSANGVSFTSAANAAVSLPLVVSSVSLSSGGNVVTLVAGASGLQTVSSTGNVVPLQGGGGFLYSNTAPTAPITGDRWLDSETLKEFVFTTVGATGLWIEPAGDGSQVGATGATGVTGVTGSTGATGPVAGADTQVIYNSAGTAAGSANLTFNGTTLTMAANPVLSAGTANGVMYLNSSNVVATGSALTFNGSKLGVGTTAQASFYGSATFGTGASDGGITLSSGAAGTGFLNFANSSVGTGRYAGFLEYLHGSDALRFGAGATEQMRLTTTGLGIGTSSVDAAVRLAVVGGDLTGSNNIAVQTTATTTYSIGRRRNPQEATHTGINFIKASGAGGYDYDIAFFNTGTNGGGSTERLRITSGGAIGIGTSSPSETIFVQTPSTYGTNYIAFNDRTTLVSGDSDAGGIKWYDYAGAAASIGFKHNAYFGAAPRAITFNISGSERVRITNSGVLDLATGAGAIGQIKFPATQVASADPNILDDYEKGTWTPTCVCTGQTITYTSRSATYTKIGNIVRAQCAIVINTVSGAAGGNTTITGLPFANGDTTYTGQGMVGYNDGFTNTIYATWISGTEALFRSGTRSSGNDAGGFTAGGYIFITWVYRA